MDIVPAGQRVNPRAVAHQSFRKPVRRVGGLIRDLRDGRPATSDVTVRGRINSRGWQLVNRCIDRLHGHQPNPGVSTGPVDCAALCRLDGCTVVPRLAAQVTG